MSAEIETIQRPLAQWLTKQGIPFINPRSDKESTIPKGWPDFSIYFRPPIQPLFIECKDKDTRITKDQELCHTYLRAAGHTVVIARSLASALEAIQTWQSTGIVRNAALGPSVTPEWAIAQDGTNGDFLFHKHPGGKWTRNRRATIDDLAQYPRIIITR